MGFREVKAELNKLEKDILIKHISELYKRFKPVKEYFDFYVNADESKILKEYKQKVREGFFPKRGYDLKLSISRKAINDFKKIGTSKETLADLLLYYAECGVEFADEFADEFGDIYESFYVSVENTYEKALELMKKEGILDKFEDRCLSIVNKTEHMGWGFHDYLSYVYRKYYEKESTITK